MVQFIAGLLALYLLLAAIRQFGRLTPGSAAKIGRGGGFALGIVALLLLLLRGSFGLVGLLASFLFAVAGELALAGVKAFMFQEGDDRRARTAFQEIARVTGGAYGAFNAGSAARLATLLRAAAAYAAGGRSALEALASKEADARPLLAQMRG